METNENELLLIMAIEGAHSLLATWQGRLQQVQGQAPVKKRISEAGKEAISKAQRARWDAIHQKSDKKSDKKSAKKHKLSPEGRQAIIDATKKRWANFHRQQKPPSGNKKKSPRPSPSSTSSASAIA
jgi:histidinol dehydrogenase